MYNLTVQNEALTLAGYLSKVDIKNGWNLSKPDIESAIARSPTHIGEGFSDITTQGWEDFIGVITRGGLSFATSTRDEFSDSIKKGSTANATLWDYSDGSDLDFLRCSVLSLRPQASSTHDEKLTVGLSSFSRSTLASIWSISSWGKRIPFVADLLFFALVAIKRSPLSVMTPYTNLERKKRVDVPQHLALMCPNTLLAHGVKKATPQSATNTAEASNHNVNEAYTMALQHSTQTHPKFQYLFLAVCRSDLNAKPHRESVTAHSEQDARRSLAGQFVLSFAGRIPNRRVVA